MPGAWASEIVDGRSESTLRLSGSLQGCGWVDGAPLGEGLAQEPLKARFAADQLTALFSGCFSSLGPMSFLFLISIAA